MRKFLCAVAVLCAAPSAFALGSFEGEEEPTVIYDVQSGFRSDSFDNMTSPTSGTYRFFVRYRRGDWWDGDRNTTNTDRQRAEVKGLGAHQKTNERYEYKHSWRTSRGGSGKFWHFFQLKSTNGDSGSPLVVNSIHSGTSASQRYCSGSNCGFTTARSFSFSVGSFQTVTNRIKVSTSGAGECLASVNGDSFSGRTGINLYRPSATDYRPKWGLYRGVDSDEPYGDDYIEHRSVSATKR